MLDSGATGLIISPDAANELHLTEYGTVFVAGIGGKQSSCFRQAESLRIGELEIEKPLLMEVRDRSLNHSWSVQVATSFVSSRKRKIRVAILVSCEITNMVTLLPVKRSGRNYTS